ncbi:MAG: NADPH:quinone reductase [Planctomycetaceae bacterium]|nr:NADPH:quinone reductase [Planctomycetaceae bacterium]
MKAIVVDQFGDENVLKIKDMPDPEPRENEVRVRVRAAGVNPVETYIRSGKYANLPSLPYTPGNDAAGVVDKVGPGVKRLAAGDRVFVAATVSKRNTGSYAELMVCDEDAVQSLPEGVSFSQGAGLGTPGLAATYALFSRGKVNPGEIVLIHGATGGVGTLAVQLARRAGAIVFGTAGNADGEKLIQELGAHHVFNHKEDGYTNKITDAATDGGLKLVIEMVANVNLTKDLAMLSEHGRVVVVGNHGSLDFNPRDIMGKDATVMGIIINSMSQDDFVANMFRLSAGLETGMKVVVDQEVPLAEAPRAHKLVSEGKGAGKIVLTVGDK